MQLKEPVISNYKTYALSRSPIPLDIKEYFLNEDANYNFNKLHGIHFII